MTVARGDAVALTQALVRVDSRNPTLVPDGPGELPCARVLAEVLRAWGLAVEIDEVAPGRPNVVARAGSGGGRSLMFNGHLDVVGIEGMTHAPFDPAVRDGRMYGRGATDMKAGIAAMCAATVRAMDAGLAGDIVIAAVCDEEMESLGTLALLERGVRADAAIVTEPTRLSIMPAHRGFVWSRLSVHGRAAHGSRYDIGVDAVRLAALVLAELDAVDAEVLPRRTHPLLGRGSLHASTIRGGVGWSTYPDRCVLELERRTIPGESAEDAVAEIEAAVARVRERRPELVADVERCFAAGPSDVATDAPIVRSLVSALEASGEPARIEGMSAWTDCAHLNAAGIPAICFGPGDIALAHAAEEWVDVGEIERATDAMTRLAGTWGR